MMRLSLIAALAALLCAAVVAAACGGDDEGGDSDGAPQPTTGPQANVFQNPSFEDGAQPWFSLETEVWGSPFTVSQAQAQDGASSALVRLLSEEPGPVDARRFGVVQEVSPEQFPEFLSGNYYVEHWVKGTPKQYLQAVVIVFNAGNPPPEAAGANNYQIRYVLTGLDLEPFVIDNGRFVFLGRGEPELGRWIHFEANVREDFEELWGDVPEGYSMIRVLFETNFDDRLPSDPPSEADVYYDNLYFGDAALAP